MIDEIVAQQKITPRQALAVLQKANANSLPFGLTLVDKEHLPKGADLFFPPPPGMGFRPPPPDFAHGPPGAAPGFPPHEGPGFPSRGPHHGPPFDSGFGPPGPGFGPPGPPGPGSIFEKAFGLRHDHGPRPYFAVPLKCDPTMYLMLDFSVQKGMFSPRERILMYNFIALFVAVVFASTISLLGLFYSMRNRARLAAEIIQQIKNGNLKARFPIKKADEVGQLMIEFNKMADEVEGLIQQLKTKEQGRMSLLQELAHDLRTPVASLKNLLETMHERREGLKPSVRDELMGLSLKEVDYFARLIEDLLTWAQVSEPTYLPPQHDVDLIAAIEEEIDSAKVGLISMKKDLIVLRDFDPDPIHIKADPHLMRRMLRNALGNAFSFANKTVTVSAHLQAQEVLISIRDDGPGLSPEALKNFGEKRMTRSFGTQLQDGRLSLGLGSLIMKSIAQLHRGQIEIRNVSQDAKPPGALLVIRLDRS